MNWILLLFALEIGYAPYYASVNADTYLKDRNIFYVTMEAEVDILKYLFIGGTVKTYVNDKPNDYKFTPFEADYILETGLRYKNIELGFKHFCLHPVRPFEMYYPSQDSRDGGYEEFYIRISN